MKKNALRLRFLLPAALACVLVMVMATASNITTTDPLVSLSYLNGTIKNQLISDMEKSVESKASSLDVKLQQRVNGVKTAVISQSNAAVTHSSVNIPANSSYSVPNGSEFLFITGNTAVQTAGLSDLTDGKAVSAQEQLVANHLYTATASVTIKASEPSRILIRK